MRGIRDNWMRDSMRELIKEDKELIDELIEQTAMLEVLKIVRDNLSTMEKIWRWRKNTMNSAGILFESNVEISDYGEVMELRITCRVPADAGKVYAKRRELYKQLCRILEERGKEYIKELFASKREHAVFKKGDWGVGDEYP